MNIEKVILLAIACGFIALLMSISALYFNGFSITMCVVLVGSVISILGAFASLGKVHAEAPSD